MNADHIRAICKPSLLNYPYFVFEKSISLFLTDSPSIHLCYTTSFACHASCLWLVILVVFSHLPLICVIRVLCPSLILLKAYVLSV